MKISDAIKQADTLRPNAISEEQKAEWLHALDCEIAEMMGVDAPENIWPCDRELLLAEKHLENVYVLYLCTQIDYYHGEASQYENDRALFNTAYAEARAWWIRHHRPVPRGNWRI